MFGAVLCVVSFVSLAEAQSVPPLDKIQNQAELDRAGAALDAALFDSYNKCDLDRFASFFVNDVEFYHDQGGVTLGKTTLTDSVKKNICGKVRRELVPGTLEVYPVNGYGAVAMGVHRFYHPGRDNIETPGEAKFVIIWQKRDAGWKMTRAISYDHHVLAK
jgi:ketosteroid isomerase-like protein